MRSFLSTGEPLAVRTITTLGTPKLWPLLTCRRCLEVPFVLQMWKTGRQNSLQLVFIFF
jgi:hypothetical protein